MPSPKLAFILGGALVASLQPTLALAQTQNPAVRIYQFTGVYQDSATNDSGTATVFTCTNFSGNTATLRFVMRDTDGITVLDQPAALGAKSTFTYSTKATVAHAELIMAAPGGHRNASMAITSTELEVRCMGKVTPAADSAPGGYVLPSARFFQTAGASE